MLWIGFKSNFLLPISGFGWYTVCVLYIASILLIQFVLSLGIELGDLGFAAWDDDGCIAFPEEVIGLNANFR